MWYMVGLPLLFRKLQTVSEMALQALCLLVDPCLWQVLNPEPQERVARCLFNISKRRATAGFFLDLSAPSWLPTPSSPAQGAGVLSCKIQVFGYLLSLYFRPPSWLHLVLLLFPLPSHPPFPTRQSSVWPRPLWILADVPASPPP